MIKSPTILSRRSVFRAGAGLAAATMATPLLTPASRAQGPSQAGAVPLNGNGFYRFKIGDFRATVVLEIGYGQLPVGTVFRYERPWAELAKQC